MRATKLKIEIDNFDNAAMEDCPDVEVVNILRALATSIRQYGIPHMDGKSLKDSNGNKVGIVTVDSEEEPEEGPAEDEDVDDENDE